MDVKKHNSHPSFSWIVNTHIQIHFMHFSSGLEKT